MTERNDESVRRILIASDRDVSIDLQQSAKVALARTGHRRKGFKRLVGGMIATGLLLACAIPVLTSTPRPVKPMAQRVTNDNPESQVEFESDLESSWQVEQELMLEKLRQLQDELKQLNHRKTSQELTLTHERLSRTYIAELKNTHPVFIGE